MSNYLYQLIAKNFNLINTIQPLVLSAFEPLPESIPDWEPSTLTTEETELPKSTPNLPEEPNFKLSLGGFFAESVLSQSTPGNLLLTPNTDEEINPTPPITAPTRLLQKQLTEIDSVVYFGESPEVGSGEQLPTQPTSESEMISPATNQVASPPSSEPFKPAPVSEIKPSLSSRVVSALATESNTSLSNPIDRQSQPKTKSFPQQLIEINRLGLSLQSPFKPDLQIYFDENQTETVVFTFASQEKTFSQPSLNPTIFKTAIANENNAPMSRLTVEKLGELTTQSLNKQSIGINQAVYLHTSPQILHLKQSPTQVQAENSTILSILNVLQPDNSSYLENLSLNLSPKRKETLNYPPDSVATGVRDLGFSGGFSYHVNSQTVDSDNSSYLENLSPKRKETLNSPPDSVATGVRDLGFSGGFSYHVKSQAVDSDNSSYLENLSPKRKETLNSPPDSVATGVRDLGFSGGFSYHVKSQAVDSDNSSYLENLSLNLSPKRKETLNFLPDSVATGVRDLGFSGGFSYHVKSQAVDSDNSSYLENLSLNLSPKRKETLNFLPDSVATGVSDLGFSGGFSYNVKSQVIDQVLPIGDQKPLTSALRVETSTSTLNPVIQPQVAPIVMSTTGFANAQRRDFPIESNSHKQTLTPVIATETSFPLPHSIAEQHSKLASDVSEIPQRFVHKNVSSIQPRLADAFPKLSSLQTNSSTASFGDNLSLSVTSQPATQLTAIHSDIIATPALHPSTTGTDRQPQISFSDSHLSDFRGNETSTQEVGSQNHNRNYHKYIGIQKINPNEAIVTNPVEKLILPQNSSSNFSMSADRGKEGVQSSYFRQLEESDLKPLSVPMNDVTMKSLSALAASSKEDRKRILGHLETPPVIQVSIGRLEVRNAAPAPPLPRPKARPAPSVMSLNDYLRRRAGGK